MSAFATSQLALQADQTLEPKQVQRVLQHTTVILAGTCSLVSTLIGSRLVLGG